MHGQAVRLGALGPPGELAGGRHDRHPNRPGQPFPQALGGCVTTGDGLQVGPDTAGLLAALGVERYAIYVQDYGAPVGWRLALRDPSAITAIVTQNGNGYTDGLVPAFWDPVLAAASTPGAEGDAELREALTLDTIRWQYTHGVPDPERVSPDAWLADFEALQRRGNEDVQVALFRDYPSNIALYPALHEYLRQSQVPLLAVWGRNDEIFGPAGATAFARDLPDAEIHLLDGGHFLLESHLDTVAGYLRGFLGRVLQPA